MEHWKNKSLEDLTEIRNGVLCKEIWIDVIGFESYYKISDFGRLKSLRDRGVMRELIIKLRIQNSGYCYVTLSKKGEKKNCLIHRLVALHFIDNPDGMPLVNHDNSNKKDNRAINLEWTNKSGNAKHAIAQGFQNSMIGEKNIMSKLTEDKVLQIKELYATGQYIQEELAAMFNIKRQNISKIVLGLRWKHI